MKLFKKNQVIIYVIALMLVTAGYLNYTSNDNLKSAIQTSSSEEELAEMANIGDAQLVSSNDIKKKIKLKKIKLKLTMEQRLIQQMKQKMKIIQ
ncbi:MAG: SpoIIIAH-like family protein [Clostridia bacterium]